MFIKTVRGGSFHLGQKQPSDRHGYRLQLSIRAVSAELEVLAEHCLKLTVVSTLCNN